MPSLLTDAELDDIGQQLYDAGVYPDTCVVQRLSGAKDRAGAQTNDWVTTATVACRVDAPARQPVEAVSGGRVGPIVDYDVFIWPRTTVVGSNDRILVNGRTLNVVATQDALSFFVDLKVSTKAAKS